jgi:hypothetical protein
MLTSSLSTPRAEDIPPQAEDIPPQAEDILPQAKDIPPQAEHILSQASLLSLQLSQMLEAVQWAIGTPNSRQGTPLDGSFQLGPFQFEMEDWKHLSDSANVIFNFFEGWRSTIPTHLAWNDSETPLSTDISLASLRVHFYELLSVALRPYVDIALWYCRHPGAPMPGTPMPQQYIEIVCKSVDAISKSVTVSNKCRFLRVNHVSSCYT